MNMMNKCAKFQKNSPSAIELSETADFVLQLCIETLCKRATSVAPLTNFPLNFFMRFSQKMPLSFFYTIVQKVKNDQKFQSIRGGGGS